MGATQHEGKPALKLGQLYEDQPAPPSALAPSAGGGALTAEEEYLLDVSGYCVLPALIGATAVGAALAVGEDGFLRVLEAPALVARLEALLGPDFRLDITPALLPEVCAEEPRARALVGGAGSAEGRRLRYWDGHGPRRCCGVTVVVALADAPAGAGGLACLPCSHKSCITTPAALLADPSGSLTASLLDQPVLNAGDVLLLAGSLCSGLRPWRGPGPMALLTATFASGTVFPAGGYSVPAGSLPPWFEELSPEQKSVCNARFTGQSPSAALQPYPALSHHGEIDPEELFFWDLTGVLIVRE
jgi:hypothetical protein